MNKKKKGGAGFYFEILIFEMREFWNFEIWIDSPFTSNFTSSKSYCRTHRWFVDDLNIYVSVSGSVSDGFHGNEKRNNARIQNAKQTKTLLLGKKNIILFSNSIQIRYNFRMIQYSFINRKHYFVFPSSVLWQNQLS